MNKVERVTARLVIKTDPLFKKLAALIKRRIAGGDSVADAVAYSVRKLDIPARLKDDFVSVAMEFVKGGDGVAERKLWLNKVWPGDDMSLSGRVNDLSKMADIKASISQSLKAADTWKQTALKLADKDLTKADLAAHIDELTTAARRAGADPAEYRRALAKSMKAVQRLKETGAPAGRLRGAYRDVIDLADDAASDGFDKAVDRLVTEKMRSNAERIAITEAAKADMQQGYVEAVEDEDVVAIGYDLNDSHDVVDICDFHTSVNLYGLGKGVYPLDHLPPYPFHPRCRCQYYNVYKGEATKIDNKAAEKYLKGIPESERRALLGRDGAERFDDSPGSWKNNLRNYQGHKPIKDLLKLPVKK